MTRYCRVVWGANALFLAIVITAGNKSGGGNLNFRKPDAFSPHARTVVRFSEFFVFGR